MTKEAGDNAKILLDKILKISGQKIVTLITPNGTFQVDIDEEGRVGYQDGLELLFLAKLVRGLCEGGGLIIRQFLDIRVKRAMPNGKTEWIPEKNIYAVALGNNTWRGCTGEEAQNCCTTDASTREYLPPEEGVHFRNFVVSSDSIACHK